MTLTDTLMIIAVLVGPILAVQVQKIIEIWKERRNSQLHVFRTLMATRATTVSAEHVNALNMVGMFFSNKKKKEKLVIGAWLNLLNHFDNYPQEALAQDDNQYLIQLNAAGDRSRELLVALLINMSTFLGYDFEEAHIRTGCYIPKHHVDIEQEITAMRKGILQIIAGHRSIGMDLKTIPDQKSDETVVEILKGSAAKQMEITDILRKISEGEASLSVSISDVREQNRPLKNPKKTA